MQRGTLNMDMAKQSIRDLTRIHNVPESKASSFVDWFAKKYKIPGFHREFLEAVRDEIAKMEAERTGKGQG